MVDFIGPQKVAGTLLKTRFWFGTQVVSKSEETHVFFEGRAARVEGA